MISQTQTSSNQYGFYAVPKKLQPKKKYRQTQYDQMYDNQNSHNYQNQNQNDFQQILSKQKVNEKQIQRDYYVDQAPYPEFKPKQRGLDYGVQIEKQDLFDYQLEVKPLLEILVGRSVVSAINQLQEEKQRHQKKQKLQAYQKKRNAQLMVTQRLQAKSKRKKEQSQRRVLQKQIYVKNQKQTSKKIIARKNAKKSLLGLKNQIFNQLQEAGYLRSEMYTDLRINYQGWLYDQITNMIKEQQNIKNTVYKMVNNIQNTKQDEHKKNIQKQKNRREAILNQRQRIRKENQQRKQKKRIRKQRLQLNNQRQPNSIKFQQLIQKYQQIQNIIKSDVNRSNGFVRSNNGANTIYIGGGLAHYLLVFLNQNVTKDKFTADQIEQIIIKIVGQSTATLQFNFSQAHFNLIQQALKQIQSNPSQFMKNKSERINELKEKLTMDIKWLQMNKVQIKGSLLDSFVQAILNITLNTTEVTIVKEQKEKIQGVQQEDVQPQVQETPYELTQKDKQRDQIKKKIQLKILSLDQLNEIDQLLRIRFQRKYPQQEQSDIKQSQKQVQQPKKAQQQWIDIFDGQGWKQHCKKYPEQSNRQTQKPAAVTLSTFERAFVYDQRTLYFLRKELQKILELEVGPGLQKYLEEINNLPSKIQKSLPVYDSEIRLQ